MRFLADLHIHSHYSISTSRELTPPHLEAWARRKGVTVLGTGDFTHPGWLAELEDHLEPADAERGLYRLKGGVAAAPTPSASAAPVRFLLSAEISNIYRQGGRTRKVHNLIFAPDFQTARRLQRRLSALANLASDGRPIIGASSRDLLEMALECDERMLFVPAHIWTPWFSVLGDKSGFDSIEECYGELGREIRAVETGLSSDPPMNWLCSFLDRYTLISNSDAHSPEKLGRECNLFDCELSYAGIAAALRRGDPGFLGTVEFFPEEGKYHHDGHRNCGVRWDPAETLRRGTTCPVCGKPLTVGVLNRVARLADREALPDPATRPSFRSLIPLKEILAEIAGVGAQSREVERQYESLLAAAGPELPLLMEAPEAQLKRSGGELLAEAVRRMRAGEVLTEPGYDGQYGRIRLFAPGETRRAVSGAQELGFTLAASAAATPRRERRALLGFDFAACRAARRADTHAAGSDGPAPAAFPAHPTSRRAAVQGELPVAGPGGGLLSGLLAGLNPEQLAAATHERGAALVLAGPGTGKTHTLTARVAFLLEQPGTRPQDGPHILALTFTHKAAREIRLRLEAALGARREARRGAQADALRAVRVVTFHAFGLELLRGSQAPEGELQIIEEPERLALLASLPGSSPRQAHRLGTAISRLKQDLVDFTAVPQGELREACTAYAEALQAEGLLDLDDLVRLPVLRLQSEPALLESWQGRLGSVLVDEYQDVNYAQYRLLRLLAPGAQANLWAVGDPNQAIYGFRGADVRYIQRFREDYPGAAVYSLPRSYRCSDTILQASGQVLAAGSAGAAESAARGPAPGDQPTALQGPEPGIPLQVVGESSDRSEAEFVARTIENMLGGLRFFSLDSAVSAGELREGIGGLADFAVLCRTSRQMPALEQAFRDHAIPYRKTGELPFFKQEPSRSLLAALRKALRGDGAGLRALPVRGALERLLGAAGEELAPLLELAAEFGTDWRGFLELTALGGPADGVWPAEQVSLLTLHAAKGLEWPCVFIVGCEEGLLPYTLFDDREQPHDEAEERRLFYVGMTRARRFLYLSRAARRTLFGRELALPPSRYLTAIQDRLAQRREPAAPRRPGDERDRQLELFSPRR